MMKRIVSLTLVVLMVAALFVGCSSDSGSPEGTYKLKSIAGKDLDTYFREEVQKLLGDSVELTDELYKESMETLGMDIDKLGDMMTMVFEKDSCKILSDGEETSTGTWKLDGEKLTITDKDGDTEVTFKNGEISMEIDGETWVLGK